MWVSLGMYVCVHHFDKDGGDGGPENGGWNCVGDGFRKR